MLAILSGGGSPRVANDSLASCVKVLDIYDNSDEKRLRELDEKTAVRLRKKYAYAINFILEFIKKNKNYKGGDMY